MTKWQTSEKKQEKKGEGECLKEEIVYNERSGECTVYRRYLYGRAVKLRALV